MGGSKDNHHNVDNVPLHLFLLLLPPPHPIPLSLLLLSVLLLHPSTPNPPPPPPPPASHFRPLHPPNPRHLSLASLTFISTTSQMLRPSEGLTPDPLRHSLHPHSQKRNSIFTAPVCGCLQLILSSPPWHRRSYTPLILTTDADTPSPFASLPLSFLTH